MGRPYDAEGTHGLHVPKRSTERTASQGRSACLAWQFGSAKSWTLFVQHQAYNVDQEAHVPVGQSYDDLFLLQGVQSTGDVRPAWVAVSKYAHLQSQVDSDVPSERCQARTSSCRFASSHFAARCFHRVDRSIASRICERCQTIARIHADMT